MAILSTGRYVNDLTSGYVSYEVQYRQLQADVAIVSFIVLKKNKSTYRSRNSLIGNIVPPWLISCLLVIFRN